MLCCLNLIACFAGLVSTSDQADTVAFLALSAALPWQAPAFPMSCQRLCRGMHSPRRQSVMQSGSDGTNTLGCLAVQHILKLRVFVSKLFAKESYKDMIVDIIRSRRSHVIGYERTDSIRGLESTDSFRHR